MEHDGALARAMLKAANSGDVAAVEELLGRNRSLVAARDATGSTPLHRAAWKGHLEVARVLLANGADPNLQDRNEHYGGTPLHAAAHGNQKAVVALLVAHGADVHVRGPNGRTPLEETAYHKATAAAKVLRAHGATA
jgi:ankyrin repeat protein